MEEINVRDINYQEEIKKCKTLEDVTGKNGLLQRLFKGVMKQLLEDKKIIGLYARGMTTRDIQAELEELYGIDMNGYKDILGIWIGESEGTNFLLSVCNNLKKVYTSLTEELALA